MGLFSKTVRPRVSVGDKVRVDFERLGQPAYGARDAMVTAEDGKMMTLCFPDLGNMVKVLDKKYAQVLKKP